MAERRKPRQRALQAGFSAHLAKPIDLPQFVAAVQSVMGVRALRRVAADRH